MQEALVRNLLQWTGCMKQSRSSVIFAEIFKKFSAFYTTHVSQETATETYAE
jgi:hypothetical protein